MTETERLIERLIAEVRRNTEIVALVHVLENAERCQQHVDRANFDSRCGEYAIIRAHYGMSYIDLCPGHWGERQRSMADPAVQAEHKKNWGKDIEPPRTMDLPRAKQVRRLLALLRGEDAAQ